MSGEIDRIAASWASRAELASLGTAETAELQQWLAADPRHLGAYARARALMVHLDRARALGSNFDIRPFQQGPPATMSRRRVLRIGGAVAASVAAVVGLGVFQQSSATLVSTTRGEIRRVPLPDGSSVTLNTFSELEIAYTDSERRVRLRKGEALFDVAKDPSRPFTVEAAGSRVTAIGTSFTVHALPQHQVEIVVREGVVELQSPVQPTTIRLSANMIASITPDRAVQAAPAETGAVSRKLAWREGMIAFNGETLREAITDFARYSDLQIVIDDPSLANRTITGIFSANDPAGFAKAIATSFGWTAERRGNKVRLFKSSNS